uniref:SWI/SNF-related matrix-associated actin-dependent regulator of chromatin subfamily A containing DEAD/H box 1 homolog n=1 Tax=Hirondellea gigas TaxID=1518452 RepID=A0A6A7FRK7_9CRUS
MNSSLKKEKLRNFRIDDGKDDKKQGSILRFVRRDPSLSNNTTMQNSANGQGSSSSPISPKISTIVVRKPTTAVTLKSSKASTTAQAFTTFNSSAINNVNKFDSNTNSQNGNILKIASGSPSSCIDSIHCRPVFIDSPTAASSTPNGNVSLDSSLQDSPIFRVKVLKYNRIIDSDDDNDAPPSKKTKLEYNPATTETKPENVLVKSFDQVPVHLIDKYLDTLLTMYPLYDKMELQDILHSWNYNFSETSCFLEKEQQRQKDMKKQQSIKDTMERLQQQLQARSDRTLALQEKETDKQRHLEIRLREKEEQQVERAKERLKMVEARQHERQLQHERKLQEKLEKLDQQQLKDSRKTVHKEKLQNKKKMFKMLGASSRFHQQEEDDDEDLYIGKSNVYISDDSEDEECNSNVDSDVIQMREVVLSFLNDSTEAEICTIPGCSKKKVMIIIAHRPYTDWDHLVEVFRREKHIVPDMLNGVKNVLQKRNVVNQLMKRCQYISADIQNTVTCLMGGKETDAAITKQPALLNKQMQLKGYQMVGLNWLSLMKQHGLNGVLADEMGLGKTIQAIAYLAHIEETEQPQDLSLIVVPSSTLENWARELELWCPSLGVLMYHGSQEERRGMRVQILSDHVEENTHIVLTTYNMISSCADDRNLFKRFKFHTVIFDEAHMLKNMNSQRFENLMKINAECRILLTGTPLQNNLVELMSILVFVMPQLFEGRKEELKQVFTMFPKSDEREKGQYESKRIEQAKKIMKPFFLRRLKVDVLKDLPAKTEVMLVVSMSKRQHALYHTVVTVLSKKAKEMKGKLDNIELDELEDPESGVVKKKGIERTPEKKKKTVATNDEDAAANAGSCKQGESSANMLMTLRRLTNHPLLHRSLYDDATILQLSKILKKTTHSASILSYIVEDFSYMSDFEIHQTCLMYKAIEQYKLNKEQILDSGKFEKLDGLLPEMKKRGDRVLIFSQFVIMLNIVEEYMRIRGYKFLRLDGQTPVTERQDMIDQFNEDGEIFVFLLSTRAGGLGINLTSANTVILHDIDFNPYNDRQAEDRCHRVGQTRPVTVIRFITKDSIEEGIRSIAQSKLELEREVTGLKDDQQRKGDVVTLLKAALGIISKADDTQLYQEKTEEQGEAQAIEQDQEEDDEEVEQQEVEHIQVFEDVDYGGETDESRDEENEMGEEGEEDGQEGDEHSQKEEEQEERPQQQQMEQIQVFEDVDYGEETEESAGEENERGEEEGSDYL